MAISGDYFQDNMKEVVKQVAEGGGGEPAPTPTAADVTVAAGDDGLAAGDVQAALQALATRVQALEDAT